MLLKNDIPIFYLWTPEVECERRFGQLNPIILGAFQGFGEGKMTSNKIPNWDIRFPDLPLYSHHLEKLHVAHKNTTTLGSPTFRLEYWIVDFWGWRCRFITN
jgi:hypothetical protein